LENAIMAFLKVAEKEQYMKVAQFQFNCFRFIDDLLILDV